MTPADLELARGAIRAVRATAPGRGIAGPAALRLADAADVLIEENERMRALLILFRATVLANREWAVAQMHAADACEMLLRDHMRTTAMNTEMRALLDQRPAINSGLIKTYTNWSARVYQFDFMNAFDDTHRNGSESK